MKLLLVGSVLMMSLSAFSQTEVIKTQITEVKKQGCPMVNGKEDCTVKEVKTKIIQHKKSITN